MEYYSKSGLLEKDTILSNFGYERQLKDCLDSTLNRANLKNASIDLFKLGSKQKCFKERTFTCDNGQAALSASDSSYPILYHRKQIGSLNLSNTPCYMLKEDEHFSGITKKIALMVKRYQVKELSWHYLGKELGLMGQSEQILKIEKFIEKASSINCPVVIEGEFGCEKLVVASAIHYNSKLKHKPFVEVNCSTNNFQEFQENLFKSITSAINGTIFLSDVDQLDCSQQYLLVTLLTANTELSDSYYKIKNRLKSIRIIASSSQELDTKVQNNSFSKSLYAEFNFLNVHIPPLRERKEDIPLIIEKLIAKHKIYDEQCLSNEVLQALSNYEWPENFTQLEHVLVRLLTLSNSNPINLTDLSEYVSELSIDNITSTSVLAVDNGESKRHKELINNLLKKDFNSFTGLHIRLQTALTYLADHYCESITLSNLSKNSFVSASHLSYLFKLHLKKSFKQVLSELRIEKAKQIFKATPHTRITDVSLEVGFGDLSHFEKIFKRYTLVTPREYKNQQKLAF